jgi:hypothetical protein
MNREPATSVATAEDPGVESDGLEADALDIAEVILLRFGDRIPDPTQQDSHARLYACLLGIRAKSLYTNFLHSLSSPAAIAPTLAIPPLVEAVILSKWISLDPTLHGELWFAQSEDRDITAIREMEKHLGISVRGDVSAETVTESVDQKAAWRDEAVARGKAAGKNYGDKPMPTSLGSSLRSKKRTPVTGWPCARRTTSPTGGSAHGSTRKRRRSRRPR